MNFLRVWMNSQKRHKKKKRKRKKKKEKEKKKKKKKKKKKNIPSLSFETESSSPLCCCFDGEEVKIIFFFFFSTLVVLITEWGTNKLNIYSHVESDFSSEKFVYLFSFFVVDDDADNDSFFAFFRVLVCKMIQKNALFEKCLHLNQK